MKVVYVCTLERGGPLSHVRDLALSVAAEGMDVHVVCASAQTARELRANGVAATAIAVRHKFDLRGASAIWPLLRGADVVHTHDRRAGLLARTQAPVRGAHSVHTFHGLPDELFGEVGSDGAAWRPGASRLRVAWLRYGLLRLEALLSYVGTVVVPSRALLEFVLRNGFPATRLRHIPYGVATRRRAPRPCSDPPRIGTAAILERRKGIDVLLEACARLSAPYELHVFGDGRERAALEAQSRRLRTSACFHGFVDDLGPRLDDLDVFALPTRGDNLPVAILEAMASALPVIATKVGGNPELVEDGVNGRLVAVDDVSGLADALEWTLTDEGRRQALGRAGAQRLEERFHPASVARRIVALYDELCASST